MRCQLRKLLNREEISLVNSHDETVLLKNIEKETK